MKGMVLGQPVPAQLLGELRDSSDLQISPERLRERP